MDEPVFIIGRDEDLDTYLTQHIPSQTASRDGYEFIHVQDGRKAPHLLPQSSTLEEKRARLDQRHLAIAAGQEVLQQLVLTLEAIEADPALPPRPTTTSSAGSWRTPPRPAGNVDVGEPVIRTKYIAEKEALTAAKARLRDIAVQHGQTTGKWMFFVDRAKAGSTTAGCDDMFATLAHSLATGPLSQPDSGAFAINVSMMDPLKPDASALVCLFMKDVFDPEQAKSVLETVVGRHGYVPRAAKPDLYTAVGLYKNDPSRLPPIIWKVTDFFSMAEIKKLLHK